MSREERGSAGHGTLPPPPRKAGVLPDSELLSGDGTRSGGVITLFKTGPILNRKCVAFYLRDSGCPHEKCNFCLHSLREAPSTDPRDLAQALRRTSGSSNARSRPGTPGDRRGRSDSTGSAASVGSQYSSTVMAAATSRSSSGAEVVMRGSRRSRETWHMTARLARPSHQRRPRSRRVRRW